MRTKTMGRILLGVITSVWLAGGVACADDGLVFRALGVYKGRSDISDTGITCEYPSQGGAIADGSYQMGLWNSYGQQTLMFPDANNGQADPCGGYLQLQNNMLTQGINVDRIQIKMKIPGARQFAGYVPTRKSWPLACKQFRRYTLYAGTRLDPVTAETQPSNSGLPNVGFVQMLPMLSSQVLSCLRSQYAGIPTSVFTSLPVVFAIRATGTADNGETWTTNTVRYTLTLRHTCGNGRVDDGEFCDPNAPNTCLLGACSDEGMCGDTGIPCATDADCIGTCVAPDDPSECTCVY